MTGFGRGEYHDSDHRFTVEIRAVNHRFNDIILKIPKTLGGLEDRVRKSIAGTLARGRIDVVVTADDFMERPIFENPTAKEMPSIQWEKDLRIVCAFGCGGMRLFLERGLRRDRRQYRVLGSFSFG